MFIKLLLISLVEFGLCSDIGPSLNLNIMGGGSIFTCEDSAFTALEGKPLEINVNFKRKIVTITCRYKTEPITVSPSQDDKIFNVDKVTTDMGTIWNCTIVTDLAVPMRSVQCPGSGQKCVGIDCRIRIHVRRIKAPQVILVNGMLMPSEQAALDQSHDALAEYTFNDGDLVDVTCANPRGQNCSLIMDYNYTRHFPLPDQIFDRFTSPDPVGFQMRMGAANDKTRATCTCHLDDDITSVRVNFLMRKEAIANSINVYINGAALRTTAGKTSTYNAEYEYQYKRDEGLHIRCASESGDVVQFLWKKKPTIMNDRTPEQDKSYVTVYLDLKNERKDELSFQCTSNTNKYKILVTLKPRDLHEANSPCSLTAKLTHSNDIAKSSLDINKSTKRYFIYEYNDSDTFDLTCTARCNEEKILYLAGSDGHDRRSNSDFGTKTKSVSKNIDKSDIVQDNVFQCKLNASHAQLTKVLVFVPYVPTTTSSTTSSTTTTTSTTTKPPSTRVITSTMSITAKPDTDTPQISPIAPNNGDEPGGNNNKLVAAVSSVACIVLICVCAVIYKIRNRKDERRNPQRCSDLETLTNGEDSPIPPFPREWESNYTTPIDQAAEPTYNEPCAGPRTNIKTDLYTLPVPKSRRKRAENQTDPTYEELQDNRPNFVQNTMDDGYTEIAEPNRDIDGMYTEISPTTESNNLNRREYLNVMPNPNANYAQVVPKSLREEGPGGSKYVNTHSGRYVNANAGSEYAEPAYCEHTYLNRK